MIVRNASELEDDGVISAREAEAVLATLCIKFGFCVPPLWHARLRDCPPRSIAKFTDTVFHAEGLDPRAADSSMYKAMFEEVRAAFERSKASIDNMPPNTSYMDSPRGADAVLCAMMGDESLGKR